MKRSRATLFMRTAYNSLAGVVFWCGRNWKGINLVKIVLQNMRSFFYTMKCKHFIFWRLSLSFVFYLFNWFVVFSFVVIIRKVPGMQLPDLASTSLFTAVGLNHKKLARPSESPTNSSRSWFPLLSKYVRLFESVECSSLNLFFFSKLTINLLF